MQILSEVHPGCLVLRGPSAIRVLEIDRQCCALRENNAYPVDYLTVGEFEMAAIENRFFLTASGDSLEQRDAPCMRRTEAQRKTFAALFPETNAGATKPPKKRAEASPGSK